MHGVSLPFKLKLNELHYCKQYCQVFSVDKHFMKKCNIKSHSLSGSRIVCEAFIKVIEYICMYLLTIR